MQLTNISREFSLEFQILNSR
uniref:Uncharacterized protein n=1 Tax=Arundo donax TaxID=35708 RepID=A0A0A9HEU4_ARUDO